MAKYLSDNCYCCGDIITHGIYFESDIPNNATNHITTTSYVGVHEAGIHQIGAPDYNTLFKIYCSYADADNSNLHCHVEPISPITASDITIMINEEQLPASTLIFDVKMDDSITIRVSELYQYTFILKLEGGSEALVRVSDLNNIIANNNKMFVSPDTDLPIHLEALRHAPSLIVSQQENCFEDQQQADTNCVAIAAVDSNGSSLAPYTVLASVDYVNEKITDSGSGGEVINPVQYTSKRSETLYNIVAPDIYYQLGYHYKPTNTDVPNDFPIDVAVMFRRQVFKRNGWTTDAVLISFDVSYQDTADSTTKSATFKAWLSGFAELVNAPIDFYFNNPKWNFDNNNFQIYCHLDRVSGTSNKTTNLAISNFYIVYEQLSYIAEEAKYQFNTMCLKTPKLITNNVDLASNSTLFLNNQPFIDVYRNYSDSNQITEFYKIHNCCEIRGPNDMSNQNCFIKPSTLGDNSEPISIVNNGTHNNLMFVDELCGNPYNFYEASSAYSFSPTDYKFNKSLIIGAKDVNLPPSSIYSSQNGNDELCGLTLSILPQGEATDNNYDQIDSKITLSTLLNNGNDIAQTSPFITLSRTNIYPEEGGAYTPSLHANESIELFGGGFNGYQQPVNGSVQFDVKNVVFSPYVSAVDNNKLHAVIDYTNKLITCDFDIATRTQPTPPTPTPTSDDYVSRAEYNELLEEVNDLKQMVLDLNTELIALKLNQT